MHQDYFPPCPVEGLIDPPVPFGHLGLHGAVPQKCAHCKYLFEGSCARYFEEVEHFLHLDHGSCGINGPTDPVLYENEYISSKVEIPRKCARCVFLHIDNIHGFYCHKDKDIWGDFPRGLDWGAWEPDHIYLQLPLPKVTTKALSRFAYENDIVAFIKEHRRINPGLSLQEAKADFAHFCEIFEKRR